MRYGLRNSLLIALMPTASSAQILGNNESMEPFTNNIYARTVLSGQFMVVNKHLISDLRERNAWTTKVARSLIENGGSMEKVVVDRLSDDEVEKLRRKYKTVYEIPQRTLLQLSADRGRFICQTQSLNVFFREPSFRILNARHFAAWNAGLKTCIYYLRQPSRTNPINFALDAVKVRYVPRGGFTTESEGCVGCSS